METCQTCTTRGADQCAAIWNFDAHIIACLRGSADVVQKAGVSQISIAQFLIVLCRDEAAQHTFRGLGVDPRSLEVELSQLVTPQRQTSGHGRVVLSQTLNALLVAAEETAHHARLSVVTLDVLVATLLQNAAHDVAAGLFHRHVSSRTGEQQYASSGAVRDRYGHRQQGRELMSRPGEDGVSQRQARAFEQRQASDKVGVRAQGLQHSRGGYQTGAPSVRVMSQSEGQLHRTSESNQSALKSQSYTQSAPRASALEPTVARDRKYELREGRDQSSTRSGNTLTRSSSRFEQDPRPLENVGNGETGGENEHYETILRMLRVQEARLERLESSSERKRSGLKVRKIGLGSLSSRSGKSSKSQSKRQSQSQSTNSGSNRSYDTASARGSYEDRDLDRDRSGDRDRDGQRTWSSRESDRNRTGRDWKSRERSDRDPADRERTDRNWGARQHSTGERASSQRSSSDRSSRSSSASTSSRSSHEARAERSDRSAATHNRTERTEGKKEKRFYLSREDDLVDAPSIGPKTAVRFTPLGIHTVRDLLELDADAIAAQLNVRHISADVLRDWQAQARLVCTVPWLRGTHAQLLVGADYRSAEELAKADLGEVLASILRFASTNQGERVLRTNPPPEREKVATWLGNAKLRDMSRVA